MSNSAMPAALPALTARLLAVAVLVVLVGAFLGAPATAAHRHDGPGFYDPGCPLAALAAVDRHSGVSVAPPSMPIAAATALVALPFLGRPALTPAADVRFRAPPAR
jgi:hypothetical protein